MAATGTDHDHLGAARLAFFTPVRDQPPLADRKASVLLAADGLMVTVLTTFAKPIDAIIRGPRPWASGLMLVLLAGLAVLILVGAWCAMRALTRPMPPVPAGPVTFGQIAGHSLASYQAEVRGLDHDRAVAAILHYNYTLATLCVTKFALVNRAMRCARATFELWMVLLVLIVVLG